MAAFVRAAQQRAGDALHFASNVLTTSKSGYGLDSGDLAVVICLRHGATAAACARTADGKADAVYKELTSNLIGNSHMVPSGIVAVGHAQERGYAYAYCG
jgi:intracellular sulfur oxidation DsrE/DsrF family protein